MQTKRTSFVILKMDMNNQYGQAMTKPLPYGCVKRKQKPPTFYEFNKILDSISDEDKIGHLFIVDIKFESRDPKYMLLKEIYPPVFEKNKIRTIWKVLSSANHCIAKEW